jgi:deoxyribodipyrimidine photo-lyase
MSANRRRLADGRAAYFPYVEPSDGAARGLLEALSERAAVVVTDDFPAFFLRRMVDAAGTKLSVRLEAVDGNGLIPLAATDRDHPTAYAFRRFVQKHLVEHISDIPLEDPLTDLPPPGSLPQTILDRWAPAFDRLEAAGAPRLEDLDIDHGVGRAPVAGGSDAAQSVLDAFLDEKLTSYGARRNRPEDDATSDLSPYLHFGHISSHQVFLEIMRRERWSPENLVPPANGRRSGWWGVGESAEGFLDQLITWRELGFHFCHHRPDFDRFESLPGWAQSTLEVHSADRREHVYPLEEFEAAATHDPLWNAAQTQLLREGRIHNYLRMLWGKKILEWTAEPRDALEVMIELNNKYALDGRDPNSYSGIFWVLGRHDRAWGPERPIFGTVRYMSSKNTARKVPVRGYIERYS